MLFASNSVMAVYVYDENMELLFKCIGSKDSNLSVAQHGGKLHVTDCFTNIDLLRDFINGKYDSRKLFISSENIYRNTNYEEYSVEIFIKEATLIRCSAKENIEELSKMDVIFSFDRVLENGDNNVTMEVRKIN